MDCIFALFALFVIIIMLYFSHCYISSNTTYELYVSLYKKHFKSDRIDTDANKN